MAPDLKEKSILFIEDSNFVRFSARRTLEEQGYIVNEAASAEEALLIIKKAARPFDLIIADIHLPNIDGLTLLRKIKNMPLYTYKPVMILSADKRISLVKKAVALGAVDFLCKPFSALGLLKRVEKIIGPGCYGTGSGVAFLKEVLSKEVNRAKRGESTFTLVLARRIECEDVKKQFLFDLIGRVQGSLREIDLVTTFNDRIIAAVLPITGVEGAGVVIGKMSACLPGKWCFSMANYPGHGKDVDALLNFAEKGLANET